MSQSRSFPLVMVVSQGTTYVCVCVCERETVCVCARSKLPSRSCRFAFYNLYVCVWERGKETLSLSLHHVTSSSWPRRTPFSICIYICIYTLTYIWNYILVELLIYLYLYCNNRADLCWFFLFWISISRTITPRTSWTSWLWPCRMPCFWSSFSWGKKSVYIYICICIYLNIHICTCIYKYSYICIIYICIYTCICIYI